MNRTSTFAIIVCVALGGCIDTEEGLEGDEPTVDTTEAALLASSHFDSHSFGGNIFSQPFLYVTQQNTSAGDCSPGFVRPAAPVVHWTSQSGGYCQFAGWASSDSHDCRAVITGSTGGGWFGGTCDTWVYEVPPTSPNPSFSYNAVNTSSATVNTVNYAIVLGATQTLTFGTCGVAGGSFTGDTYLRLYDPSGNLVASNDDSCGGLGSHAVYTSTVGGAFQVRAGCYSSSACSGTVAWTIQ
jgi:hypothetical protein